MSRHLDHAVFFSDRGRHQDAVRELLAHLRDDPENGYVHGWLALEFANLGQCEQGRVYASKAIGLLPEKSFPYYTMAHVCFQSDQMPEAADWIAEAIERDPHDAKYFYVLAAIRAKQGRYGESLKAIHDCLALDPEHHECLVLKSSVQLAQGNPGAAARTSRAALRLSPESALAHINQSYFALQQGQNRWAFQSIREGLRLDPESVLGRIALRQALIFTNPILVIVLAMHLLLARGAPIVLLVLAWLLVGMETEASPIPAAQSLDQIVGTLIVYALGLLVVLAKPAGDFYIQLFRDGRSVIERGELQVSGCLLLLGMAYLAALGLALSTGATSPEIIGFFLFLPAMMVAAPPGEISTWNAQRRRKLLIMVVALPAILLPLLLRWLHLLGTDLGHAVAIYQSLIAITCMCAFYSLRGRKKSV